MSIVDRKESEVRALLDTAHPLVPPYLAERTIRQGRRVLGRRRVAKYTFWLLAAAVVIGLAVWAGVSDAWVEPADTTTPDFTDW
ncbi:hypothetical protein SRB5_50280 [Streptomyces sp. RB5]|uniref:Uncharacterized protein n=1 Tax=Streptomyces smaragdinus TaxID=2585196 RepID=A0A7K0CP98_9ACTN|nr:hypothetical protein [Streptomyces smaragdinus]MQY14852.1 hypothetical protein [Streptomyces smaragdinus]